MKGLLKKDFYLTRSLGKSYLLILAIFALLAVFGVYTPTFLTPYLTLMCVMCPINLFSYDELSRWDKYAAALPAGRQGVVMARYLFTLLLTLAALVLVTVIEVVTFYLGVSEESTLIDTMLSGAIPVTTGVLINALLLPLLFKFGTQKARIYLMVLVGLGMGAVFGLMAIFGEPNGLTVPLLLLLLSLVCVLSLIPSYFVSLRIYQKKDL